MTPSTARLQLESEDWWQAVGGHCGFAKAGVKIKANCFNMCFIWRLEDTFKGKDKNSWMEWLEKAGMAQGFWVTGELSRYYKWSKGNFDRRYKDPLKQGGKTCFPAE